MYLIWKLLFRKSIRKNTARIRKNFSEKSKNLRCSVTEGSATESLKLLKILASLDPYSHAIGCL